MQDENISTPIYVQCDNIYRQKVCSQEFWYFMAGLEINLSNPRTTILRATNRLMIARCDKSYTVFFIDQYKFMAQWLREAVVSEVTCDQF